MRIQIRKCMLMLAASLAMLLNNSCSNDAFFGFEEDSYYPFEENESRLGDLDYDYLDYSYEGLLSAAPDSLVDIYIEAYNRLGIINHNGRLEISYTANDVNISRRLYEMIEKEVQCKNRFMGIETEGRKRTVRRKVNCPEGIVTYNGYNCVCFGLCYQKYGDVSQEHLQQVNSSLLNTFGSTYTTGNLVPDNLPSAGDAIGIQLTKQALITPNSNIRAIWCAGTGGNVGHTFIITRLNCSLLNNSTVFFLDPTDENPTVTHYEIKENGNKLPLTIDGGVNNTISLVYM